SNAIDSFLASRSLVNWSADIVSRLLLENITPHQIVQRAIQRLDAKSRGILLLHDIHPATVMALPSLLKELKERGYRIVHVIPAGGKPETMPAPNPPPSKEPRAPRMP